MIDEESDEYNMTNSQYSMQQPGGMLHSRVMNSKMVDPRSNNKSMQSVHSLRSMASNEGYKSNSQLFVVQEDGFHQGNNISGKTTPYVPANQRSQMRDKVPGRMSDATSPQTEEDGGLYGYQQ